MTGAMAVIRDITERKRMEASLRQSEKLGAMGSLLAGVAHELNNPLAIVAGHAHILKQSATDERLVDRAGKMTDAVDRCARIIKNFLALARQAPPERSSVGLNTIIREAVELIAYPLRVDSIEVALDLSPHLPVLWADGHQLHQVVVNLVTNAHHALRETEQPRRITVTTRAGARQRSINIQVADNGPGIPTEVRGRIFEPFFTTKPVGKGTGLGLSLCQSIIADHGGTIEVASEPGRGAVFSISLPVRASDAVQAAEKPPEASPGLPRCRILIVDDEAEVAGLLAEMLEAGGHRPDIVTDGMAALQKLAERPYDVVLSDLRMPNLDGPALYREVERRYPQLKARFAFITGDALGDETRTFLEGISVPHLGKPFSADDVLRVLRHVLVQSGQSVGIAARR
jgi:two-component system NtrC family sensor kinase